MDEEKLREFRRRVAGRVPPAVVVVGKVDAPRNAVHAAVRIPVAVACLAALTGSAFLLYMELDPDRRDAMRGWPIVGAMLAVVDPVQVRLPDGRFADAVEGAPADPAEPAWIDEAMRRLRKVLPGAIEDCRAERSAAARDALEAALAGVPADYWNPLVVEARFYLYVSRLDAAPDPAAEAALEDLAERHFLDKAAAHLAVHYYDDDRYDRSRHFLEMSPASRVPGSRVGKFLARVEYEEQLTAGFASISTDHCRVRYAAPAQERRGRLAAAQCESAYRRIQDDLTLPLTRRPIAVVLVTGDSWKSHLASPVWAEGQGGYKAFINCDDARDDEWFSGAVRHEVCHTVVHWAQVACPSWVDEGLAQYYEHAGEKPRRVAAFEKEIGAGRRRPMRADEFPESYGEIQRGDEVRPLYLQAASLVFRLFDRYGKRAMHDLLMAMRYHGDVDAAFRAATSRDPAQLFTEWWKELVDANAPQARTRAGPDARR